MRIRCLTHAPFEGPGSIEAWARDRGHELALTRVWAGDALPPVGADDWLFVLGGPMSVHDEAVHPWMAAEKRFLRARLDAGKRVVGVCLGAQLLAEALGARVVRARASEIGWFPVTLTREGREYPPLAGVPERWEVLHWHGETFDLPRGAVRLAGSEACANQAFAVGSSVLAFQFHPEATRTWLTGLIQNAAADLVDGPYVEAPAVMLGDEPRFASARERMRGVLDALATADQPAGARDPGRS